MSVKRNRSSNFTKEEQLTLVIEIARYKDIIEDKTNNKASWKAKMEAWKEIEKVFNATASVKRTPPQLQSKYENLKSDARRMLANQTLTTAPGDSQWRDIKDDILLAVLDLMNVKSGIGLTSKFDSKMLECDTIITENDSSISKTFSETNHVHLSNNTDHTKNHSVNKLIEDKLTKMKCADTEVVNKNYSEYNSRRQKKPIKFINQKLRFKYQRTFLETKRKYYEAKRVYLEGKIRREEEEHSKKMILLDLELEKLKKELA